MQETYASLAEFRKDKMVAINENRLQRISDIRNKGKPLQTVKSTLKPENKARWDLYLLDEKLVDEIEKDIKRTRSDIGVFRDAYDQSHNTTDNQEQLRR